MSRGHPLRSLLEEYPISTVKELTSAAYENRTYDTVTFSGAVAAGAVHAIEAGFSGKPPKILKNYQDGLLKQLRKVKGTHIKQDASALLAGFGGIGAPQEKVKRGRRKINTRSSN